MSNSVKKSPACTDHHTPGTRWSKRMASKAARRFTDDVQNGKWYRRLYCSWNICDHRSYRTKQQAIQQWDASDWLKERLPTEAAMINDWEKSFRRK